MRALVVIGIDTTENHAGEELIPAVPFPEELDFQGGGALAVGLVRNLGLLRKLAVLQFQRGVNIAVSRLGGTRE